MIFMPLFFWSMTHMDSTLPGETCADLVTAAPALPDSVYAEALSKIDIYWSSVFSSKNMFYRSVRLKMTDDREEAWRYNSISYEVVARRQFIETFIRLKGLGEPADTDVEIALAHEAGHHIQKLRGIYDFLISQEHRGYPIAGHFQKEFEWEADCLSGRYFASKFNRGYIPEDKLERAKKFVLALGSDDSNSHNTSEVRWEAFMTGVKAIRYEECDKVRARIAQFHSRL